MNKLKNLQIYRICCNYIFPLILLLYPLRHISRGLDLWDTGYNYANFRYMGRMDTMWLFSTYLTNVIGHLLTLLPGGHTLLFMNLYTALFLSLTVIISYRFLTKRIGVPEGIVFVGEFVAVSLCWCPTASLYNYLTYLLFLVGVLFLYEGLTQGKKVYLILAGVALGCNIFVRFSNIPEAGLIVAVWAYGVICRKKIKEVLQETAFCMLGYFGAVILWLGFISIRYGLSSYVLGIKKLFSMTDTATDYKASSMLYGILHEYVQNFYWVNRILIFMIPGIAACLVLPKSWKWIKRIICAIASAAAVVWLYSRDFCDFGVKEYSAMYRPGVLFLILTLFVCMLCICSKRADKNEKLLAGMIILVVFITSLGSNNGLKPGINNLFLAVPYVLWNIYRLCRKDDIRFFAIKAMAVMFIAMFMFQSIYFGMRFVFVRPLENLNIEARVENNNVLKGIKMSRERADWMEEISAYVSENQLTGSEVILYGNIPSLSFYLEMPFCFSSWSDLLSYSMDSMTAAIDELKSEISEGAEFPIVILNKDLDVGAEESAIDDPKLLLILDFMEEYGYIEKFSNDRFILYEAEMEKKK